MSHLTYGYKMGQLGNIIHQLFDSDSLLNGEAKELGWYDSPNKVPGFDKTQRLEEARKVDAETYSLERNEGSQRYGQYTPKRGPGRPRKA